MTSKEALKMIEIRCRYYALDYSEIKEMNEAKETIGKDLEVLEILKKYIKELNKWAYFDEKTNKITTLKIISMIDLRPENEDYKTIKEWLEDDKQRSNRENNC